MKLLTFEEIAVAAQRLPVAERRRLLVFLAQSLRESGGSMPEPRDFSPSEIQGWMDEDERDSHDFCKSE